MSDTTLIGVGANETWYPDLEIWSATDLDDAVEKAKNYISAMNLTSDDVRIVRRNGNQVLVLTKREIRQDREYDTE